MAQANNSITATTRNKSGTDRRAVLQLIGGVAALPTIAKAESETAIAMHFEIWRRYHKELRDLESAETEAEEIYDSLRPHCPLCLRFVNSYEPMFAAWVRDATIPDNDRDGRRYQRIPASAINDAIVRLERVCPDDAPILVEAKRCLPIAYDIEDREARAWREAAVSECLRATDAKREIVVQIEEIILALDATNVDDLKMQAEVLRDNSIDVEVAPQTKRFLNSILTSRTV